MRARLCHPAALDDEDAVFLGSDEADQTSRDSPSAPLCCLPVAAADARGMSEIDKSGMPTIILMATMGAAVSEFIAWLLIFRTEGYARLKGSLDRANKSLEKQQGAAALTKSKGKEKKASMLEKQVEQTNRDLNLFRMRSNLATAIMHMVTFFYIKSSYDGMVVARLPFQPFGFVRSLSHRNIEGDDFCECGVIFVYVLCSMSIKPTLQRMLGQTTPPPQMPKTIFGMPTNPAVS